MKNILFIFFFWLNILFFGIILNFLSVNPTKWSNTLKQFVGSLLTNCLSNFDNYVGLVLKELKDLKTNAHQRYTNKLIYTANQLTGFYKMRTLTLNRLTYLLLVKIGNPICSYQHQTKANLLWCISPLLLERIHKGNFFWSQKINQ